MTPRPLRRLRHARRLLAELVQFAGENRAWWMVPIAVVVVLLGALILAASFASPLLYTVF